MLFKQATGILIVHIPYRGSAPAFTDLIAGRAQVMAESIPQAAQNVKSSKLRAPAVTNRARNPALPNTPKTPKTPNTPNTPTMIEAGARLD